MCIPQFDSPSIFGKILDPGAGHFSIAAGDYQIKSAYIRDSAILEFSFESHESSFLLKDFMTPIKTGGIKRQFLIRKFKGTQGISTINLTFSPKINYGEKSPVIKTFEDRLQFDTNQQKITLFLPGNSKLKNIKNGYLITFTLEESEKKSAVMEIYNKKYRGNFHPGIFTSGIGNPPGRPKITSIPQSINVSTKISDAVRAIFFLHFNYLSHSKKI